MKNMNGIIIGICVIIGCAIISKEIPSYNTLDAVFNNSRHDVIEVKNSGAIDTYEQNLENEFTHWIKVPSNNNLVVWERHNKLQFNGIELKATFYHVSNLLIVEYLNEDSTARTHYINNPDRWEIEENR